MQGRVSFKTSWDEEGNEPVVHFLLSQLVLLSLHPYPSSLGGIERPKPLNRPREGHCPLTPSQTQTVLPYIINPVASLTHNCITQINIWWINNIHQLPDVHFYYTTNIVPVKLHLIYLTLDRGFEILANFSDGFPHSGGKLHFPSVLRFELLNLLYHRLLPWRQHRS